CLGSGIALLVWRLARPEEAVLLPPGFVTPTIATATPGVLGTPLPPPLLPDDPAQIVMLPVSERPSLTPTQPLPPEIPTVTASHTLTATATLTRTPRATATSVVSRDQTFTPTPSVPTIIATSTAMPTLTVTLGPTATYAPSLTPVSMQLAAIPDRILIDRIALDAPVLPVGQHTLAVDEQVFSQWNVPEQRAAGWHHNSAPLDQPGNLVLNGHHNVYGEVFRYINVLEPGDWLMLEADGRRYYYVVVQTMTLAEQDQLVEVRQENARWILPTDDERVTLITCWPYYANTHRVVVIARPIDAVIPPGDIP
ncbi:MAG: sortase, partial [Anaerolineae bacterium]|nr:sortase [Anaerolineae bacterium]